MNNDPVNELIELYREPYHNNVIKLIERGVDLSRYKIIIDKYYKIYIPHKLKKLSPCLCAHTDTIHLHRPRKIYHRKNVLFSKNGLGADDRNGCYLISQMMKERGDDFVFALFDLEEQGCVGSRSFPAESLNEFVSVYIGLDRQGSFDIALYGYENDELLKILSKLSGYTRIMGSSTDVAVLAESSGCCCFNLSVGFYREHTSIEYTNIKDVIKTRNLLLNLPSELWGKRFEAETMSLIEDEYFDEYPQIFPNVQGGHYVYKFC